jgi:hypothetical protein
MLERLSSEPTSHSMMWMLEFVFSALRSERSAARERTPAMMVLEGLMASCRTNSRPMPRLAPVRKYVGILVLLVVDLPLVGSVVVVWWECDRRCGVGAVVVILGTGFRTGTVCRCGREKFCDCWERDDEVLRFRGRVDVVLCCVCCMWSTSTG